VKPWALCSIPIQLNGRPKGEALGPIGRGYTVARVSAASHALTAQAASGGVLPFVPRSHRICVGSSVPYP
jgi:hypothetical protein